MPPALSEYDFSSEPDTNEDSASKTKGQSYRQRHGPQERTFTWSSSPEHEGTERPQAFPPARPCRKSKRSGLLSGLDVGNVIAIPSDDLMIPTTEGSVPARSVPSSSHRTRGSTRSTRSGDLAYDQKYHPIDEYLRPSQAAKRRAEHSIGDEGRSSVCFEENHDSGSSYDEDDPPPTTKRRKLDKFDVYQSTRRSTRRVNRHVLYDMTVHPQDSQIEEIAEDNRIKQASEHDDEVIRSSSIPAISRDDSAQQSEQFSAQFGQVDSQPSDSPRSERTASVTHEKPMHTTLAEKATSTIRRHDEHDNAEAPMETNYPEETTTDVPIRPMSVLSVLSATDENRDLHEDQFLHLTSMFEGASDLLNVPQES